MGGLLRCEPCAGRSRTEVRSLPARRLGASYLPAGNAFYGMEWILLFSPSRCLESTRSKRFLVEDPRRLSARCLV